MKPLKLFTILILLVSLLMTASPVGAQAVQAKPLTPIVIFPTEMEQLFQITVRNQAFAPECPRSGSFQFTAMIGANPQFSPTCVDKMLTLVDRFDPNHPGAKPLVTNQPGVQVKIVDYSKTSSWPAGEDFYVFLESKGYTRNQNIRVAGYDFRLTPDLGGWLERTTRLIEDTYTANHNTPVHLAAFSVGANYAQYLLMHVPHAWKNKYIQGFTLLESMLAGGGGAYILFFTGMDFTTFSYPATPEEAAANAGMWTSFPTYYMNINDPAYFGGREQILRVALTGKTYYAKDAMQLFKDAGLTLAQKMAPVYWGTPKFLPPYYPNVDTYAEKGSGIDTTVAVELPDLKVGQMAGDLPAVASMDGDGAYEYLALDAVKAWSSMPCYRFQFTDNPGLDFASVWTNAPVVWQRLVDHANLPRSVCR